MNYPYATGNIKALESKLIDRNKLIVLTKYNKSEFHKVLLSMNYGECGDTIEELIANEMAKTKELIDTISPSKKDTDLFYLVNDAQNIKILYKVKKFELNKLDLLQDTGSMVSASLKKAIIDGDFTELNKSQIGLIECLNRELCDINNPKKMSFIIDNDIYKYALKQSSNMILKDYLTSKIDFTNVISMIRAKNLHWNKEDFFEAFIDSPKNNIKKSVFDQIYDQFPYEDGFRLLEPFYEGKLVKVLRNVIQTVKYNKLEIEYEKLSLDVMSKYKDDLFTIGPMIYYYLLKKAEAQNIRILYSSNEIDVKDLI